MSEDLTAALVVALHFDAAHVATILEEFKGEEALALELLRVAASMGHAELPPIWRRVFAPHPTGQLRHSLRTRPR
jgi:hypothetical protein